MEIESSSRHVAGGGVGSGDGGDDNNNNRRGKKPLLQQQKENQRSRSRKTKGRRKIQIRRIMSEHARLSTFSKRRSGVYKKADDIATFCGCQVGIVGITLAGRTFAYGNPNIEVIIRRFLEEDQSEGLTEKEGIDRLVDNIVDAYQSVRVNLMNFNHDLVREQIEEDTQKLESLNQVNNAFANGNPNPHWVDIDDDDDEMSLDQVNEAMQDLRNAFRLCTEFRQTVFQQDNFMPPPPQPPQLPQLPQPPQPPVVEYNEGESFGQPQLPVVEYQEGESFGQPLQADVQDMMMIDTVMEDPSSSAAAAAVAPATNNNIDEEIMDEEDLMLLRFVGDFPSSPPGPF